MLEQMFGFTHTVNRALGFLVYFSESWLVQVLAF